MKDILIALWPVFILLLLGYTAKHSQFLHKEFWSAAEKATYFVLFPVLLVYKLSLADFSGIDFIDVTGWMIGLTLAFSALLAGLQRRMRFSWPVFTSVFQGTVRFNTYVSFAVIAGILGDDGVAILAVLLTVMIPLVNLLSVAAFSAGDQHVSWRSVSKSILRNPLIIACFAGFLLNLSGFGLPTVVASVAGLLAAMALPLGVLCVGAGLRLGTLKKPSSALLLSCMLKLLLMPLSMLGLAWLFVEDYRVAITLIIFSALPTAPSAYILSRQLGGDSETMAAIISVQTLLACISLPVILMICVEIVLK